jgi:capsular exopolysaccharide synthesis family protein
VGDLIRRNGRSVPAISAPPEEIWIDDYLDQKQSEIVRYAQILLRRKWLVLSVTLLVFAAGAAYTLQLPRVYSSRVNLQIEPEQNLLGYKEAYAAAQPDPTYLRTQSQVLKSEVLASRVANRLKLVKDPTQATPVARWFAGNIVVKPVEGTQVLNVSFRSENPVFAATAINTLADEYMNYGFDSKRETTTRARDYVEEELDKVKKRLHESEQRLVNYGRAHNILLPTEDNNVIKQRLIDLNNELTKADTELRANQYEALKNTTVENFPESRKTGVMIGLDGRRSDVEQRLAAATLQFGPKWPEVERLTKELGEIRRQLATERSKILEQAKVGYDLAREHRASIERALKTQNGLADQLTQDSVEYSLLKREAEADRQMHEGLLQRLKEMDVSVGLKALNIHVIDRGHVPTLPTLPNVPLNLAFALTMGLMCGAAAAYGVDFFDRGVKTPEDVDRELRMPFLAAIPAFDPAFIEATGGHLMPVDQHDPPPGAMTDRSAAVYWESYRGLRTSILFSSPNDRPHTILVTSALPGEGKSTTAVNLAIALAQTGARTLIIELDMRKPRLANVFNLERMGGISRYLSGYSELSGEVRETAVPNLFVVPAGPIPPNPPELIGSSRMRGGLELLRRHFQYVIVDGPPVLAVTDAAIIATQVDGVVLVVGSKTPGPTAAKARDALRNVSARVLGALMNNVKINTSEHPYYSSDYVSPDVVPRLDSGLQGEQG